MEAEVPKVSGVVGTFESRRVQPAIARRVVGLWRFAWIALLSLFVFSIGLAVSVMEHVDSSVNGAKGAALIGCLVAGLLSVLGLYRLLQNKIDRRWYVRGVPPQIAISFAAEADGLQSRRGRQYARREQRQLVVVPAVQRQLDHLRVIDYGPEACGLRLKDRSRFGDFNLLGQLAHDQLKIEARRLIDLKYDP